MKRWAVHEETRDKKSQERTRRAKKGREELRKDKKNAGGIMETSLNGTKETKYEELSSTGLCHLKCSSLSV